MTFYKTYNLPSWTLTILLIVMTSNVFGDNPICCLYDVPNTLEEAENFEKELESYKYAPSENLFRYPLTDTPLLLLNEKEKAAMEEHFKNRFLTSEIVFFSDGHETVIQVKNRKALELFANKFSLSGKSISRINNISYIYGNLEDDLTERRRMDVEVFYDSRQWLRSDRGFIFYPSMDRIFYNTYCTCDPKSQITDTICSSFPKSINDLKNISERNSQHGLLTYGVNGPWKLQWVQCGLGDDFKDLVSWYFSSSSLLQPYRYKWLQETPSGKKWCRFLSPDYFESAIECVSKPTFCPSHLIDSANSNDRILKTRPYEFINKFLMVWAYRKLPLNDIEVEKAFNALVSWHNKYLSERSPTGFKYQSEIYGDCYIKKSLCEQFLTSDMLLPYRLCFTASIRRIEYWKWKLITSFEDYIVVYCNDSFVFIPSTIIIKHVIEQTKINILPVCSSILNEPYEFSQFYVSGFDFGLYYPRHNTIIKIGQMLESRPYTQIVNGNREKAHKSPMSLWFGTPSLLNNYILWDTTGQWIPFFQWYLNPLWQKYYEDYNVPQDERIVFPRPDWVPQDLESIKPEDVRSGYFTITAKEIQNIIEQEKEKMKTTVETTP